LAVHEDSHEIRNCKTDVTKVLGPLTGTLAVRSERTPDPDFFNDAFPRGAFSNAREIQVRADQLTEPEALRKFQEAQAQLSGALGSLIPVSENYPDLNPIRTFSPCNRSWRSP
jgi:hypothetical protein